LKTAFLLLFSACFFFCTAQPGDRYHKNKSFVDFKDPKTKLLGFKNEKGKIVVPAVYSRVYFSPDNGDWSVEKDSLSGVYSNEGKLILEPVYTYVDIQPNRSQGFIVVSKDNKNYGLTDLKGGRLLDLKYPRIIDFCENLLISTESSNTDNNPVLKVIDTSLHTILDESIIHAQIHSFVEDQSVDGKPGLYLNVIKNEKLALFSGSGRQITDYIYAGLFRSRGDLISARLSNTDNSCGIIDADNRIIVPFKYRFAGVFDDNTIRADAADGSSLYFDATGKPITEAEFKKRNAKHPYWGGE
jgi:hypothetical protein